MSYRIVVDTNVLISAIFWGGNPRQIVELIKAGQVTLLTSADVVRELSTTLHYDKFADRFAAIGQTVDDLVHEFHSMSETVIPGMVEENVVRDKQDRIILACAVGGKADCIVTGDNDLLTLGKYEEISILTPAQFLALLFPPEENATDPKPD